MSIGAITARAFELLRNQLARIMASSPDAESVAAIDRAFEAAAKQLSALGTRLAAVVRRGNAAEERVSAHLFMACGFSSDLPTFASQHGLTGAIKALHSCITLPLECGSALMASPDASIGGSTGEATECLFSQAHLLSHAMSSAVTIGGAERFTAQLAPPERLLPWLSAAVSKLFFLHGTSLGRGSIFGLQVLLVQVVYYIAYDARFRCHAAAVRLDGGLQQILLRLLVPMLHASAAAMQLPAEQRPAEFCLTHVVQIVLPLTASALGPPFHEQLRATSGYDNSHARRVVQSVTEIFASMPASCPEGSTDDLFATLWSSLLTLLGNVATTTTRSIDAQQNLITLYSDAQRRSMLQQLQAAVSRLPAALRWAVKDEQCKAARQPDDCQPGVLLGACGNIVELWMLMISQELQANLHGGWAEVTVFCAAGSALLRALPHASALSGLAAMGVATGSQQQFEDKLTKLLVTASLLTLQAIKQVADSGPPSAADSAAAAEALWQLHMTLCQCIHYSAAPPAAGIRFDKLLPGLAYCLAAAEMVSSRVCAASPCSPASHSVAKPRQAAHSCLSCLVKQQPVHLLAMSVAQVEAALVVAGACHLSPDDERVARALIQGLDHGPAALASNPSVQQALGQCLDRIEAGEASETGDLDPDLLAAVQQHQQQHREPQPGDALELAKAAATRSCAYLRCANLAGEGGPAAGQGAGSQRCSKCKVAWYCGTACSHADWKAGHRRVCRALGASDDV
ncbi:hypothetical protein ACK3TF_000769 [Chlorella vulgaris]